ncbi:alpha/beta hydrolase [Pseudozobellia thermophila]|uniref:Alpha/beta hydrolase family protein n=1 Tax=Pseudozobellia thermophila TaxID=192903 RepID=A0A1M6HQA8_9FLAO|nr:alpha/beta hydrolase [Pseudozobellia thermophila]SHJ24346.1 hypothetical protein SAMN04488513_103135 [Pseudozobellia thermophila]
MKRLLTLLALGFVITCTAQEMILKKGVIVDSLVVRDTVAETFSLYLPTRFEMEKTWPILFVFDMEGRSKNALGMFRQVAEEQGYVLAASNHTSDTLSISKNILIVSRMFNTVVSMLPIHRERVYVGGFSSGGEFSTLVPSFVKGVKGVLSCGAPVANTQVLTSKNPYHFVGLVGNSDHNYIDMLSTEAALNRLKFPNQLLVFEGGHEWPPIEFLSRALKIFTMAAMARGEVTRDTAFVEGNYQEDLAHVGRLYTGGKPLLADNLLGEMLEVFGPLRPTDSLKENRKTLRKGTAFRTYRRSQNNNLLKERFLREDYAFAMEEDVNTYNYNNLGWWKYQMEELDKFQKDSDVLVRQMGNRLEAYIDTLVADNLYLIQDQDPIDIEALNFLWMLKTIITPKDYGAYLNVISFSTRLDDYGTALFYLEELLKQGYTDRERLYSIPHTALLRITPEFNKIVEQYLKKARYNVIIE